MEAIMESQERSAKLGNLEKTDLGQPHADLAVPLLLLPAALQCPTNTCPTLWELRHESQIFLQQDLSATHARISVFFAEKYHK